MSKKEIKYYNNDMSEIRRNYQKRAKEILKKQLAAQTELPSISASSFNPGLEYTNDLINTSQLLSRRAITVFSLFTKTKMNDPFPPPGQNPNKIDAITLKGSDRRFVLQNLVEIKLTIDLLKRSITKLYEDLNPTMIDNLKKVNYYLNFYLETWKTSFETFDFRIKPFNNSPPADFIKVNENEYKNMTKDSKFIFYNMNFENAVKVTETIILKEILLINYIYNPRLNDLYKTLAHYVTIKGNGRNNRKKR